MRCTLRQHEYFVATREAGSFGLVNARPLAHRALDGRRLVAESGVPGLQHDG